MALRMLTRMLPIAFDGSAEDHFETTLFWHNKIPKANVVVEPLLGEENAKTEPLEIPTFDGLLTGAPLGERLLDILTRLCFLENFTVVPINVSKDDGITKDSDVPLRYAWAPGTFTPTVEYYNQTWQFDNHRMEVCLALVTALSRAVYMSPEKSIPCPWLEYFTGHASPFTPVLFASLLNVAMRYDPVGWGVPYNHILSRDVSEQLMNVSLELLSIILEYKSTATLQPAQYQQTPAHIATQSPAPSSTSGATSSPSPASQTASTASDTAMTSQVPKQAFQENIFITLLQRLGTADYDFIFNAVLRILNNPVAASNTYLPNSTKSVSCEQEMLTVFWQLIQLCRPFLSHTLRRDEFVELVYPVLHYVYQGRKDSAQLGRVHLGVFFLLYLSGEREFSIALNKPFNKPLVIDIPKFSGGTYADYLVLVLVQMIVDGQRRLDSLWECLLTILSNISPYIKSLTMVTSTRLLKLFVTLSKRSWLLSREKNHRYVFFLLETFNNILQYQFEGNTSLVYSIISYRDAFFKLLDITKPPSAVPAETITAESVPSADVQSLEIQEDASKSFSTEKGAEVTNLEKSTVSDSTATSASATDKKDPSISTGSATQQGPSQQATTAQAAPSVSSSTSSGPQSMSTAASLLEAKDDTFRWTQAWVETWAPRLPIGTIIRFLNGIIPQIEAIVEGAATDQDLILNFLKKTTLVGILPVPHPILIRHYNANKQTHIWFLQYIWGVIFIRHYVETQVFTETTPRLFNARLPSVCKAGHKH